MAKTILLVLAAISLCLVVVFSALVAYAIYANNAADNSAASFCQSIRLGSNIDAAVDSAAKLRGKHRVLGGENEYLFMFQGGVFHAGLCRVGVSKGIVVSVRAESSGD